MTDKHEWMASAANKLRRWAKRQRKPFTIEQARTRIASSLDEPADLRWWGGVTTYLLREKALRHVDQWAPARSSHGSPKPMYVGA